jgi:hypothetical protein
MGQLSYEMKRKNQSKEISPNIHRSLCKYSPKIKQGDVRKTKLQPLLLTNFPWRLCGKYLASLSTSAPNYYILQVDVISKLQVVVISNLELLHPKWLKIMWKISCKLIYFSPKLLYFASGCYF